MSDRNELKEAIDGLGHSWEEFKKTHAKERAEIRTEIDGARGETKEKMAKLDAALSKFDETKAKLELAIATVSQVNQPAPSEEKALDAYRETFAGFMRGEKTARDVAEKIAAVPRFAKLQAEGKTLSSQTNPDGGYWLGSVIDPEFQKNVIETSPMRQIASVQTIGGAYMEGTRRVARFSTGGWVGEQEARPATGTGQVGTWRIDVKEEYAMPEATQTLLDDSVVNVEAWLSGELAEEFTLQENIAFWSGATPKRPRGLLTYPTTDPGDGAFIASTDVTTSAALVADDMINLQDSLLEEYQPNAVFALKRATLSVLRKLVTSSQVANYLWQPGLTEGRPSQILGKSYVLADELAALAANTNVLAAYGDFKKTYRILDRMGIRVVRDELTNKPFVRFYTTKRVGGDVTFFESMKFLRNK